jgi:hypothetical protein
MIDEIDGFERLLEKYVGGQTLLELCSGAGLSSLNAFLERVESDPAFAAQFGRARLQLAIVLEESAYLAARDAAPENIAVARLQAVVFRGASRTVDAADHCRHQ